MERLSIFPTQKLCHNNVDINLLSTYYMLHPVYILEFPWWFHGKESTCQYRRRKRHGFDPWVRKIPWKRKWQPIPAFLPGKSHGQRSLAGYSPWDQKESNMTEWACTHAFLLLWLSRIYCFSLSSLILSLFYLICYWTPLVYFSLQLLYSSALWLLFGTSLHSLSLC